MKKFIGLLIVLSVLGSAGCSDGGVTIDGDAIDVPEEVTVGDVTVETPDYVEAGGVTVEADDGQISVK